MPDIKKACITGGGTRMGKTLALALAKRGYDILLHYNRSKSEAEQTAVEIEKLGQECKLIQANFANKTDMSTMQTIVSDPTVSILINSASRFDKSDFLATEENSLEDQFQINFFVPFRLSQAFAETHTEGHIITILDAMVHANDHHEHFAYLLSKKALKDLNAMMALSLAPSIRCNAIAPSWIKLSPDEKINPKSLKPPIPMHQYGEPEHIIKALSYLLDNSYCTGEVLYVDGGRHLV